MLVDLTACFSSFFKSCIVTCYLRSFISSRILCVTEVGKSSTTEPKERRTLPRQQDLSNTLLVHNNCTFRKMAHAPMRWPTRIFPSRSPPGCTQPVSHSMAWRAAREGTSYEPSPSPSAAISDLSKLSVPTRLRTDVATICHGSR